MSWVRGSVVLAAVALAVTACGGSDEDAAPTTTEAETSATNLGVSSAILSTSSSGLAGVPASALPGVTVLGSGEESAPADGALIALSVGSSEPSIGRSGPVFEPV